MMVQKRKYPFINGRSILYTVLARTIISFRQNYKKTIILPLNGHALGALQWIELKLVTLLFSVFCWNSPFWVVYKKNREFHDKTENFHDCLEAEFSVFLLRFSVLRREWEKQRILWENGEFQRLTADWMVRSLK